MYIDNLVLFNMLISALTVLGNPLEVVASVKEFTKLLISNDSRHYGSDEGLRILSDVFTALDNAGVKASFALTEAMVQVVMGLTCAKYSIVFETHPSNKIKAIKWLREYSTLGLKEAKEKVEECGDWCKECDEYHSNGDIVMLCGLNKTKLDAATKELREYVKFFDYRVFTE